MSWAEGRRVGHRGTGRTQTRAGNDELAKENGGNISAAGFGDIAGFEHDNKSLRNQTASLKADPLSLSGRQKEVVLGSRSVLGNLNGISQQRNGNTASGKGRVEAHQATAFTPELRQPLWINIDEADGGDPLACSHIANDIMNNLFKAEGSNRPDPDYIATKQRDVTPAMRAILVDWMVEVAQEYKLHTETLFQAVGLTDRFLSLRKVPRNQLQLVGVSCMLIASKYEEIYTPQVEEFCFITENTYTKEEILSMEWTVLVTLSCRLTVPTVRAFLRRFVKAAAASYPGEQTDPRLDSLSCYIAELSLLEYDMLQFKASMIAASAVFLAQFCLSGSPWNPTLQHYSSYTASDLRPCVATLYTCYLQARSSELPAIRDKYNNVRYFCVASSNPPSTLPPSLFFGQ